MSQQSNVEGLQQLIDSGVRYVRILWCDNANVIRAKAAHVRLLREGLPDGVGLAVAQQALPVMHDAVAGDSGLGPVGEVRLVPDWSTLGPLAHAPDQAQVIGDLRLDGRAWAHCPREYLREQVSRLEQHGLEATAAFENEFFLLRQTIDGYTPADSSIFAMTRGLNEFQAFIGDLTAALEAQHLEPEFYYAESGPGQQELSIGYGTALAAADHQIMYRETVRGVAQRHGLVASFLPKVVENAAGSGCHINIGLRHGDQNLLGDADHPTGLSRVGRQFIAGVLEHLLGLCALTVPSCNSYRRLLPRFWAGAYRAWGFANREAAIRVSRSATGGATRFELKTADASANPYLALGGLIAAGLDGIERELELPEEVRVDPDELTEDQRQRGRIDPLPKSLGEAIEALVSDRVLIESLGEARARAYIAVRRAEWTALKDISLEDEVRMLAERY